MSRDAAFDEQMMRLALHEAREAATHGDVPVGAVAVRDGEVVGRGRNERELHGDPTAHAEMMALRAAALTLGGWHLHGVSLYVSLEPCPMCAGAIQQARVARCVFGAADPKSGAAGTVIDILGHPRLLHRTDVRAGILAADSLTLLSEFFAQRRPG